MSLISDGPQRRAPGLAPSRSCTYSDALSCTSRRAENTQPARVPRRCGQQSLPYHNARPPSPSGTGSSARLPPASGQTHVWPIRRNRRRTGSPCCGTPWGAATRGYLAGEGSTKSPTGRLPQTSTPRWLATRPQRVARTAAEPVQPAGGVVLHAGAPCFLDLGGGCITSEAARRP